MESLCSLAVDILNTPDVHLKATKTLAVAKLWREQKMEVGPFISPPAKPARPGHVIVKPPNEVPRKNIISLLHSIVHIESVAIDLSWDIIARFAYLNLPREFYDDFVKVAEDEARHYTALSNRLTELGSHYGAIPVHEGLWESADRTADNIFARLAIEHMVHEARGLDVTPFTIQKFRKGKENNTADLLEKDILPDEITHVAAGLKWFSHLCNTATPPEDPITKFKEIVPLYFRGSLKPPFNTKARETAGMTEQWYIF